MNPSQNHSQATLLPSLLTVAAVQILAFSAAILTDYAYRDDYIAMRWHSLNFDWINSAYVMDGRFLLGLMVKLIFAGVTTIESLNEIRLIGLTGGILFSGTLLFMLRRTGLGGWSALIGAIAGGLSLASVVYVGWTVCFPYSFAATLSLLAGLLFHEALDHKGGLRLVLTTLSGLLFVCGAMVYQGTSPLFLIPIFFRILNEKSVRKTILLIGGCMAAFVMFSACYMLVFKVYSALLYEANPRSGRILSEFPFEAIKGNLGRLIPRTANLNSVTPSTYLVMATAVGIVSFMTFHAKSLKKGLIFSAVFCLVVFIGFLPPLASDTQLSGYRTYPASQVITLMVVSIGWQLLASRMLIRLRLPRTIVWLVPTVVIALGLVLSARYHLRHGIIQQSVTERAILVDYMESNFSERPTEAFFITTPWYLPELSNGLSTAEFGKLNSHNLSNIRPFMKNVMDEVFPDEMDVYTNVRVLRKAPPPNTSNPVPVLDATHILLVGQKGLQ